nr:uncharacterized protein LOC117218921 [Megalopta genalis]XP_033323546.1 uncharacterized protein LOC117218921 [Megalopta genalis]XP_033323547.1 uncharacterized protein LOC117218921 [Megalopta genalis]
MEMQCNKMSAPNMVGHTTRKRNANRHLKGKPSSALRLSAPRYSKRKLLQKIMRYPKKGKRPLNNTTGNAANISINEDKNAINTSAEVTEEFREEKSGDSTITETAAVGTIQRIPLYNTANNASTTFINADGNIINMSIEDGKNEILDLVTKDFKEGKPEDFTSNDTAIDEQNFVVEKIKLEEKQRSSIETGLSIVDMEYVFEQIKNIGNHSKTFECSTRHLEVKAIKRLGLETIITLECNMCHYTSEVYSESRNHKSLDINFGLVASSLTCGGGYAQIENILSGMNIPCISRTKYRQYHDNVVKLCIETAEAEMIAAAEEEKQLAIARGDILSSGIPFIPVVADGSWMKRSYHSGNYDSISGVGVIIGHFTKKVLFIGVRNKKCAICSNAAKRGVEPRKHVCFKNWGQNETSTKMESDAIVEGFTTSIQNRGLVYSVLIADGDSSSYKKILDCDPYKAEMVRVKKIECTNHMLRRFCGKLREAAKKTPPGNYRKAVENTILKMRIAVVKATKYRLKENVPLDQKMNNLRKDLMNIPSHVFGEHKECRELGYFCDRAINGDKDNLVPHLTKIGTYSRIQEIFQPLLAHAESLLYNGNNNIAESFNSVIAKFTGGKRINWGMSGSYTARCAAAVIQFNTKAVLSRIIQATGKETPSVMRKVEREKARRAQKDRESSKRRARKLFHLTVDSDYGPNADKPDMEVDTPHLELQTHMEILPN